MPKIVRLNDPSDHSGQMVTASGKLRVNNRHVCLDGDIHDCPLLGHGQTAVVGTGKLHDSGRPTVKVGDRAGCGAIITDGSLNMNTA